MERWRTDIKDWTKITDKTATLMVSQCETLLKETIETSKTISLRAEKLSTILIPISASLLVYCMNNIETYNSFIYIYAFLAFFIVIVSLWFCIKNMFNYNILLPGTTPSNLLVSNYIDNDLNLANTANDRQYISIVISICENIQFKISNNINTNNKRILDNEKSLKTLLLLIPCSFVAGLLYLGLDFLHATYHPI